MSPINGLPIRNPSYLQIFRAYDTQAFASGGQASRSDDPASQRRINAGLLPACFWRRHSISIVIFQSGRVAEVGVELCDHFLQVFIRFIDRDVVVAGDLNHRLHAFHELTHGVSVARQ